MNKLNIYPVWNGLIYGSYNFIVCRLKKIENSNRYYWIAVYDIWKRRTQLFESTQPWVIERNRILSPFLFRNNSKYVILQFSANSIEIPESYYYEEPAVELSDKEELFFEDIDALITYLKKNEIGLDWFTPPNTKGFPLNHTTWGEYSDNSNNG